MASYMTELLLLTQAAARLSSCLGVNVAKESRQQKLMLLKSGLWQFINVMVHVYDHIEMA